MRLVRTQLFLCLAVLLPVAPTAASSALAECARGLDAEPPEQYFSLSERCPEAARALQNHPLVAGLTPPLSDRLSVGQLWDLQAFLEPSTALTRLRVVPAQLEAALAETRRAPSEGPSWWERFVDWLQQFAGAADDADLAWLRDLAERLRQFEQAAVLFLQATAILLLILIGLGLYRLLPKRRRARAEALVTAPAAPLDTPPPSLEAIHRLPLAQQLPALLAFCIRGLAWRRLLPSDRSLTNRELVEHLQDVRPGLGRLFRQLAQRVEQQVYGSRTPEPAAAAAAFAEVEQLMREAEPAAERQDAHA